MTIAEKILRAKADYDAVYEAGKNAGGGGGQGSYDEGYAAGKEAVTEEVAPINSELEQTLYGTDTGGKSFYDEFWDAYQENGTRTGYLGAFSGRCWDAETFKPKYPIISSTANINGTQIFYHHNSLKDPYDLAQHCRDNNIVIDFAAFGNLYSAFSYAYITSVGEIDFKGITGSITYYWDSLFSGSRIVTMEKLKFYETNPEFTTNMFYNCADLENLNADGIIAKNGLNLRWSTKLSKASITSIINALSTTTTDLSITLSKTAVDNAFTDDEWSALIGTRLNWTISLI